MGQNNTRNLQQEQYFRQYEEISQQQAGTIIKHKKTKNRYFLKLNYYKSDEEFNNSIQKMKLQSKTQQSQNITKIVKVWAKQSYNLCSTVFVVYSLFEYPQLTLKTQIEQRRIQCSPFDESDLWNILQSCINCIQSLKNFEIYLLAKQIFIQQNGLLKIGHPQLLNNDWSKVINRHVLYAPQKITKFNNGDEQNDIEKQLSFNLGMLLLECALLTQMNDCYDYISYRFKENILKGYLIQIANTYSSQFTNLISKLLQIDPQKRLSIDNVVRFLDAHWKQSETQEFNKSNCSISAFCIKNQSIKKVPKNCFGNKQDNKESEINNLSLSKDSQEQPKSSLQLLPPGFSSFKSSEYIESLQTHSGINQKVQIENNRQIGKQKKNIFTDRSLLQSIKNFTEKNRATLLMKNQNCYNTSFLAKQEFINRKDCQNRKLNINTENIVRFSIDFSDNGEKFEGLKMNNLRTGYGKLTYPNGSYFQGAFKNNLFEGFGKMYYSNGQVYYQGNFSQNKFNGRGILYNCYASENNQINFRDFDMNNNWIRYQGQFSKSLRNGNGKLIFFNGDEFKGEFLFDKVHGKGVFKSGDNIIQGYWLKNVLAYE